ncbi:hypothetical protein EYZ11_005205 [Aspergillus tanneri]|nr:hypothetical protein EYZ11_005205 [Aspergillus tanneri]
MQLARLSAEKRKSSSMRYITFNIAVVWELGQALESWHHVSPARVFHWQPGNSIRMRSVHHAMVIVDHVVACCDESMVSRQALLPLFFAGCKLSDQSMHEKILNFCFDGNERTRYHMFNTTIPLQEDVWAEQETKGFENV